MAEDIVNLIDTEPPDRYRFDYKGKHRYLIMLPVYASKKIFIEQSIVGTVLDCLRDTAMKHHFDVYAYCFLPGELVMIARGKEDDAEMKTFLSEFRMLSETTLGLGHPVWKKKYLERVLRKKEDTRQIANTIFQMPVKAELVKSPSEYPFQGSFVVIPVSRHQ